MTQENLNFDESASQTRAIIEALKKGRKLTPLDLLKEFGVLRASGRIYDARKMGWNIQTRMVKTSTGKRVAEYSLKP